MKAQAIYSSLELPQNLQVHMLRVAAVGKIMCDHSKIKVQARVIITTLLLHDIGNMAKINLERTDLLTKEDQQKIERYRQLQQEFRQTYGHDADEATLTLMREMRISSDIIDLCRRSHGDQSATIASVDDWEAKIAYYSDMRVGPYGIVDINQRFDDLLDRYPNEREQLQVYRKQCLTIESQLQKVVTIPLESINNDQIENLFDELKSWEVVSDNIA